MKKTECYNEHNKVFLSENGHAFVSYLTAGYPTEEDFCSIVEECQENGMEIFEIGFPAGNPYADGDIIKETHKEIDHRLSENMTFWTRLREIIMQPIWLMGYKADLYDSGIYRRLAEQQLIDALVIPDLDLEQRLALLAEMKEFGVDVLGFIADENDEESNDAVCKAFPIIYQQLYSGPTGHMNNSDSYKGLLKRAREITEGYLFAGFGIGTKERAAELLQNGFDGVIIGTAIMKKLKVSKDALLQFVCDLRESVDEVK